MLLQKYDWNIKKLERSLEDEHQRQTKDHAPALKEKIREIETKKRERELLLASFNMFSDQKAKEFVFEDSFEKLCMMITD